MRTIFVLLIALLAIGCGGQKNKKADVSKHERVTFSRVLPPSQATEEAKFQYMVEHYWDRFDFTDTIFIEKVDSMEMVRAYVEYIANYVGPYDGVPIAKLMKKASVSRKMLDYFVALSEKIIHDPNSPMRSDELYIPVLEAQIAAPFYDEYEKMAPAYDLAIATQNRVFHKANDFRYTTASGKSHFMYSIKSDYILIYINNPGCPMCRSIQKQISASALLTEMIASKKLTVLGIYPDADIDLWRKHPLPDSWINGYDKGCIIDQKRLYDLRAIPSLYLLDKDKIVLVKDSTSIPQIENVILQNAK